MASVVITDAALEELAETPRIIQMRVADIMIRLEKWPGVSGAKPLRGGLSGNFRIRTGAYRVVFRPSSDDKEVTIWKIGHRGGVYD